MFNDTRKNTAEIAKEDEVQMTGAQKAIVHNAKHIKSAEEARATGMGTHVVFGQPPTLSQYLKRTLDDFSDGTLTLKWFQYSVYI
jgi:hypothetical protein